MRLNRPIATLVLLCAGIGAKPGHGQSTVIPVGVQGTPDGADPVSVLQRLGRTWHDDATPGRVKFHQAEEEILRKAETPNGCAQELNEIEQYLAQQKPPIIDGKGNQLGFINANTGQILIFAPDAFDACQAGPDRATSDSVRMATGYVSMAVAYVQGQHAIKVQHLDSAAESFYHQKWDGAAEQRATQLPMCTGSTYTAFADIQETVLAHAKSKTPVTLKEFDSWIQILAEGAFGDAVIPGASKNSASCRINFKP